MRGHRLSSGKINLLLNILGRRADGYHEIETVLHPIPLFDELEFEPISAGIELSCNDSRLPVDDRNLVWRAAMAFFSQSGLKGGARIHLEKRIPMEAGLGGGSSNAASALLGLNELFGQPLSAERLRELAAGLGSDVVFFLEDRPALATGRGERVQWIEPFAVLRGCGLFLVHPGFGVSTPWAYRAISRHPTALTGEPGRAWRLIEDLRQGNLERAAPGFYNALEAPAFEKFPILELYQEFLRASGARVTMMSGSGSATFALTGDLEQANELRGRFSAKFGAQVWSAVLAL